VGGCFDISRGMEEEGASGVTGRGGGLSTRQVNKKERGLPSGRQDA
jgi:hypothetical protein